MRLKLPLFAAAALLAASLSARASTITFETAPYGGSFTGPITENGFTYSTYSGHLYVNQYGDPGQNLEGETNQSGDTGGVALFVSASSNPLFTFQSLDFAADGARETITLQGYDGSTLVGTDTYTLAAQAFTGSPFTYTLESAANLSGVDLTSLRITLPGSYTNGANALIDNVTLNPATSVTPEPSSLVLLGTGVLGLAGVMKRRLFA